MSLTPYHARYFDEELSKRSSSESIDSLTSALADAQVELNPHQIEAALFAEHCPDVQFGQQPADQLPWFHIVTLLTRWKNAPAGPVRKADVTVAKNYLNKEEMEALNLIVSAYLDFAELQARGHPPMYMRDWITKPDAFLRLSERNVLTSAGKIFHALAEEHVRAQFA